MIAVPITKKLGAISEPVSLIRLSQIKDANPPKIAVAIPNPIDMPVVRVRVGNISAMVAGQMPANTPTIAPESTIAAKISKTELVVTMRKNIGYASSRKAMDAARSRGFLPIASERVAETRMLITIMSNPAVLIQRALEAGMCP